MAVMVFSLAMLLLLAQAFNVAAYENNYDLNLAKRYVDFCGAAYCADPIFVKSKIENWSCSVCKNYPGVTARIFHGNVSDANGFVAYDPKANEIIISFSGTDPLSIANWIDDIDTLKESYPYCSNCQVHEGFYHAYKSVDASVKSLLNSFLASYPTASIAVTGHSLGAAMAAHCTAELTVKGYKIKASYTFGMPRVGDQAFEQWYVQTVTGTYRVVHRKDPVPQLPLQKMGFHHMSYEVFYIENPSKYTVCSSEGEDKKCQDQYIADLDVLDHLFYCGMDFTTNYLGCQI
jgi:hypothetical protein